MDPLAEISRRFSPYTYALNNPVLMIDPDGMTSRYNWETKQYENEKGGKVDWGEVQKEYGLTQGDDDKPKSKKETVKVEKNTTSNGNLDIKQGATDYIEVGTDVTATTLEYGAIPLRKSFSLNQRINGQSFKIATINKMKFGGGLLGTANLAMTAYNTYDDINSYEIGDISGLRLSYKLGSGAGALYVGATYGGPPGMIVGASGVATEILYDLLDQYWIQPMATFNTQLENALKNGWFPVPR